jgi:hypothetical protein
MPVAFYGKTVSFRESLSGGVRAPASSDPFLECGKGCCQQGKPARNCEKK